MSGIGDIDVAYSSVNMTSRTTPVPVVGLTDAVELAAGFDFVCARRATGAVVCWGANDYGQLGDGIASHGADCRPDLTDRTRFL